MRNSLHFGRRFIQFLTVLGIVFPLLCVGATPQFDQAKSALLRKDYEAAVTLLLPLAERGDDEAQYLLGRLYLRGQGVDRHYPTAAHWFERAADNGHVKAPYELAGLYESGKGVVQDLGQALSLYEQASTRGYQRAATAISRVQSKRNRGDQAGAEDIYRLIRLNLLDELKSRLEANPDLIRSTGSVEDNPLIFSVLRGSANSTALLLAAGAASDTVDTRGIPALILAIERGELAIARALLQAGANPDLADPLGNSALHRACASGDTNIVTLLVGFGANVNTSNDRGEYPLDLVDAKLGDLIGMLKQRGAKGRSSALQPMEQPGRADIFVPLESSLYAGWPLLNIAAWRGDLKLIEALVSQADDLDGLDSGGLTPLARAALQGHLAVVEVLLAAGATPHYRLADGGTALHMAVRNNRHAVTTRLVKTFDAGHFRGGERGELIADAIAVENEAMALELLDTATHYSGWEVPAGLLILSAKDGFHRLTLQLLQFGTNPDDVDGHGRSALWWSVYQRDPAMVDLLLAAGADKTLADVEGNLPLHIAAKRGSLEIAQKLQPDNTNFDVLNQQLATPLMIAAINNNTDIVGWLLAHGANVRLRDAQSNTALMLAAARDNLPEVRLLLEAGAEIKRRNRDGMTAIDIARASGATEVYDYLITVE